MRFLTPFATSISDPLIIGYVKRADLLERKGAGRVILALLQRIGGRCNQVDREGG